MAFLRAEKKRSGTYLRIVSNKKVAGKVRQQTLHSLGKVEDYSAEQLEALAKKLLEFAGKSFDELLETALQELARYNYGFPLMVSYLWKKFDLGKFFKRERSRKKIKFDVENVLKLLICERMAEPVSKHCSFHRQEDYIGLDTVDLHHCYRSLDFLDDIQEALQKHLFHHQRNLFNTSLDVVFYDVTTLYFDSQHPQNEEGLRQKGYSKDGKVHKLQVVLGLLVDRQRNPLGYQVYQGNKYEGDTFKDGLDRLKTQYGIDKVVVVADRGMLSEKNIGLVLGNGYDYIIGERLKRLPVKVQDELLDSSKHKTFALNDDQKTGAYTYATTTYKDRKVICTYSEKRARKDAHEREKLIEKAKKPIQEPSLIKQKQKSGSQKYIQQQSGQQEKYLLDEQKINHDSKYDGFLAISTNDKEINVEQLLEQYNNLFQVEHAFRTLKSMVKIRPMFHWTDKRIKGHIALCFITYTFINYLTKGLSLTEKELQRCLDKMQLSKVGNGEQAPFFLRSSIDPTTAEIIRKLALVVPKDTASQKAINQILR